MTPEFECFPLVGIPIECEDDLLHTADQPYCTDRACPCQQQAIEDGLITESEAQILAEGRAI